MALNSAVDLDLGIALACAASLANLAGGYLGVVLHRAEPERLRQVIAVGAGFLLAAALLDLVPDVGRAAPQLLGLVLVGYFIVYAIEGALSAGGDRKDAAHAGAAPRDNAPGANWDSAPEFVHIHAHAGGSVAAGIGLAVHAFFDGVAIVSGFLVGGVAGLLLFASITLHKVSVGFSLAALMRSAGHSPAKAGLGAAGLAAATVLGAVTAAIFGSVSAPIAHAFVALSAGSILYVGASDMIPLTQGPTGSGRAVWLTIAASGLFYLTLLGLRALGLG
ncbi:MAG TPA: ZIP family metal transporter [Limnochordia bacterium]|nr:ZIP family metal transporter [Limnochordia bacterium]